MISSAGNLSVSRQAVEKQYGAIISQLAQKRFGLGDTYFDDSSRVGPSARIAKWMDGTEKQNLVAGLIVGLATFAAGTSINSASSSATYFFKAPSMEKQEVSADWVKEELEFWQSMDCAELKSLADTLRDEATDALSRMLPPDLSNEQATDWALGLVNSVKG